MRTAVHCNRLGIETHRHRCEVRMSIAAHEEPGRGDAWVAAYLDHPRVAARGAALRADMQDQMNKGHDGTEGLWL